jgi:glutathione S-transferase
MSATEPVLVTIPISHYCEKARWALARANIGHREEGHPPLFHLRATRRAGGRTTPILRLPDRTITESTDILRWADERLAEGDRLFPADPTLAAEVERWEDELDRTLGPAARRIAYFHLLDEPATKRALASGAPAVERRMLEVAFPVVRALMRRGLRIEPGRVARDIEKVQALFSKIESALSDGRRHLTGDRFTAADLTFAALAAPLVLPEGYGGPRELGSVAETPYAAVVAGWRATVAGAFVLRLYQSERARRVGDRADAPAGAIRP